MVLHGHIENGAVVLTAPVSLPEGTEVTVLVPMPNAPNGGAQPRVRLPLVPSANPGSRRLTADRVAELLAEQDVSS